MESDSGMDFEAIDTAFDEDEQKKSKFYALEGVLFQLFKKLCSFLDAETKEKSKKPLSIDMILDIKNEVKMSMEEIIEMLMIEKEDGVTN